MLALHLLVLFAYCAAHVVGVIFESPTSEILTKDYDIIVVGGELDYGPCIRCCC